MVSYGFLLSNISISLSISRFRVLSLFSRVVLCWREVDTALDCRLTRKRQVLNEREKHKESALYIFIIYVFIYGMCVFVVYL